MTNEAFFKIVKDVLKDISERYFVCLAFGWFRTVSPYNYACNMVNGLNPGVSVICLA